jgi:hypothetical protein
VTNEECKKLKKCISESNIFFKNKIFNIIFSRAIINDEKNFSFDVINWLKNHAEN